MAIKKAVAIDVFCVGDGTSQTVGVSLTDDPYRLSLGGVLIANSFTADKHATKPSGIPVGATASLNGDILTIDFGRILTNGELSLLTGLLLF